MEDLKAIALLLRDLPLYRIRKHDLWSLYVFLVADKCSHKGREVPHIRLAMTTRQNARPLHFCSPESPTLDRISHYR